MKILLISAIPPPEGGIATWTLGFCDYCTNHGIPFEMLNTALIGRRGNRVNEKRKIKDEVVRTVNILKNLCSIMKKKDINVAHLNSSCSSLGLWRDYIIALILKKNRIPFIFQCHCNLECALTTSISKKILRSISSTANKILVLNEISASFLANITNCKIEIIPNFIDASYVVEKKQIREEIRDILFVGHVQFLKGCREIYELATRFPKTRFVLVGPIKDEMKNLEKPFNVRLEGSRSTHEIKKYFEQADLFLFPSYTEGFSISLLEAMSCGLPIIASDVGSNRDMIECKGGCIVQSHEINELVDAFGRLADKNIREQMSLWNINKVKDTYTMDIIIERLLSIYHLITTS